MRRIAAILCLAALVLGGCAAKEETTLTGIVVSVEGTQVTLMTMDADKNQTAERPEKEPDGTRPALPEGKTMPEGSFSNFGGAAPEGERPTMPEGEMPTFPEGEMPTFPEGEMPTMPEGDFGGRGQGSDGTQNQRQTTTVDLSNAHITVEFDGGKATGAIEDITQGVFVTITLVDGTATNAVVTENSGFGGRGQTGGQFGNRRPGDFQSSDGSTEPTTQNS